MRTFCHFFFIVRLLIAERFEDFIDVIQVRIFAKLIFVVVHVPHAPVVAHVLVIEGRIAAAENQLFRLGFRRAADKAHIAEIFVFIVWRKSHAKELGTEPRVDGIAVAIVD